MSIRRPWNSQPQAISPRATAVLGNGSTLTAYGDTVHPGRNLVQPHVPGGASDVSRHTTAPTALNSAVVDPAQTGLILPRGGIYRWAPPSGYSPEPDVVLPVDSVLVAVEARLDDANLLHAARLRVLPGGLGQWRELGPGMLHCQDDNVIPLSAEQATEGLRQPIGQAIGVPTRLADAGPRRKLILIGSGWIDNDQTDATSFRLVAGSTVVLSGRVSGETRNSATASRGIYVRGPQDEAQWERVEGPASMHLLFTDGVLDGGALTERTIGGFIARGITGEVPMQTLG